MASETTVTREKDDMSDVMDGTDALSTKVKDSARENVTGYDASLSARRRWLSYCMLVFLAFSLGCSEFVVIGIEPELSESFHRSLADVGNLISLFAISYALATPILAIFTGRVKRIILMTMYLTVFVIANYITTIATNFSTLLVVRVFMGAVAGPTLAVATTYVSDLLGYKRTSMGIAVLFAAFSIALVLSTSLCRVIVDNFSWRVTLDGAFVFSVVAALLVLITLPKKLDRKQKTTSPAKQIKLLGEPTIVFGMLCFVFGVGAVYTFYGYVTPYLETQLGLAISASSVVLLGYGCICFISNLTSGFLDMRFGVKVEPFIFASLAAVLLGLWLSRESVIPSLVCMGFLALLMYSFSVPAISVFMDTARRFHPEAMILAASVEPTAFNIGISFGTVMGGVVVSQCGLGAVGIVGSLLAVGACVCSVAMIRCWRRKK